MSKNIMFVMNQMTSGGAERVVSVLANKMRENGQNVSLVITFESEIHYFLNEDIEIIKFNIDKQYSQIKRNIIELQRLIKTFKEEKPDVIISFIRNVNSIIAAKFVGIPIIISERNNPKYDPKNKVWRLARKLIYPYADGIVFQSEGAKKYFSNKIQNKGYIIPNPLSDDIPIKNYEYKSKKEIVSVGRLCDQKDQKTLIRAFSKFYKKYPEYRLIIYGEGDLRKNLEFMIKSLNLEKSVLLPGSIKNIYDKIIKAEVFVLSSIYEGYPNALIEAMAIGLPVISTNCDYGPSEVITDYENGVLVPVGDYEKLSEKMEQMISKRDLSEKMGKNALKIRMNLDVESIEKKWMEYILSIIDK